MSTTVTQSSSIDVDNVVSILPQADADLHLTSPSQTTEGDLLGYDEIQIQLMDEVCIVLDRNDVPIGKASKKVCQ